MSQNPLQQAKAGNPQAIAALMNRNLQPKGITAKVNVKGDLLLVMLEGEQTPKQQECVAFVENGMKALGVEAIARVRVFGRKQGEDFAEWDQIIELLEPPGQIEVMEPVSVTQSEVVLPDPDQVRCPKCNSSQISANKKGFGVGKAAAGAILLGPLGLAGGMIGSGKIQLSCLNCGNQWEPAKVERQGDRHTTATLTTMDTKNRSEIVMGCMFLGGFIALLLSQIPGIGYLLAAISVGIGIWLSFALTKDSEITRYLKGNCPYCNKEIGATPLAKDVKCPHCTRKILIQENRFYTIR